MMNQLIRKDVLTGKRRLAPLGCVVLFTGALFIGACILGWYALLTSNVTRLIEPAQARATETAVPAPTLEPAAVVIATATPKPTMTALANAKVTATKTVASAAKPTAAAIQATSGITWTVWALPGVTDPVGKPIYDGPPEIKQWIVRDYFASLKFENDYLFDKDYRLANLPLYYTGKYLVRMKKMVAEYFRDNYVVADRIHMRRTAPYDQPIITQFSSDGKRAMLNDYTAAGEWKVYDTRTRKQMPANQKPNTTDIFWIEFDLQDRRWKIAQFMMSINTDTFEVIADNSGS
jgi:hypothetical protein